MNISREELIAQGCVEKCNQQKTPYFYDLKGDIVAKGCTRCYEVRVISLFGKHKWRSDNLRSECKICSNRIAREWQMANLWREQPHKRSTYNSVQNTIRINRRRARKALLPDTLTSTQYKEIITHFKGRCALTEGTDIQLDHVIPIKTGHGGTTKENMITLSKEINQSKHTSNIFEWFEDNQERFSLSQSKFDALIEYLAGINEMTTKEYRAYVDWCFDNPQSL